MKAECGKTPVTLTHVTAWIKCIGWSDDCYLLAMRVLTEINQRDNILDIIA